MDKIIVNGKKHLNGDVYILGAKNAALPIITASLLTDEPLKLNNIPNLHDITSLLNMLSGMGAFVQTLDNRQIIINTSQLNKLVAPYEIVKTMRASILVLGPMLARFHKVDVALPGGCAIGSRPVDIHISGLIAMGAKIEIENGYISATAPDGLIGCNFKFHTTSVTATENLAMAATLAKGVSILENCAIEPEVTDLLNCLVKMGAKIDGIGTTTLKIEGLPKLHGAEHTIISDRIEAGTYLLAGAATKGRITVHNIQPAILQNVIDKLQETGIDVTQTENSITVDATCKAIKAVDISTEPYPGFPTDMQAQFMVLNVIAQGPSVVNENIFENRFMHAIEMLRMGAQIDIKGSQAIIQGDSKLKGADISATDLRASAALIIAALCAEGISSISNINYIDRGYEQIEEKLQALGADIYRAFS